MLKFNTRRKTLKKQLEAELKSLSPNLDNILTIVDQYEEANLQAITKLRRGRELTTKRIAGALKQTIHAHGNITPQFIGSATKRVYGALLSEPRPTLWDTIKTIFK